MSSFTDCGVGRSFWWPPLSYEALKDPMSMIPCVDSEEVRHASLLSLYNSFPPAWVLAMVFAKYITRTGLSCVFTEHWLPANLFSLFFLLA